MRVRPLFAAALLATLLVAGASYAGRINGVPGASGVASSLVCLLAGPCTMTAQISFSGVSVDITTPGAEDLTITPGGTTRFGTGVSIRNNTAGNFDVGTSGTSYFEVNPAASSTAPSIRVNAGRFGGTGAVDQKLMWVPIAKAISSPTDTSTAPNHHYISISAAGGAAAWTPSESGAVPGELVRAVNTGTNVITMTDSAGVYEGGSSACALGQWDTVEFNYVTDRWVEFSCRDN